MFSNNVTKFLLNMVKGGELQLNMDDEIIRDTLVCHWGEVVHSRIRESLGLPPREEQAEVPDNQNTSSDVPPAGEEDRK